MKDDWVRKKGSKQLMQIDEYQTKIVEEAAKDAKDSLKVHRQYTGKVWCSWTNKNDNVVLEPFLESVLEAAG